MQTLHLASAFLGDGWASGVNVEIGPDGTISDVTTGAAPAGAERVRGAVLPGMTNLHSHSFQRAMAGLAERGGADDFWSWREAMYRFLERIGPEELYAITAQLYVELLKGGYTGVCEFHYLHNDPAGAAYDDPALLAVVIHEAAAAVGIGLTLLPSLYLTSGFGERPPEPGQRRFVTAPDRHLVMLERLEGVLKDHPDRRLGIAPHSLRAVPIEILTEIVAARRRTDPFGPVHLHLAEQAREVEDCLAWSGRRPARLLFNRVAPDHQWCLIHCTHLDQREARDLATSGAVVGLCPTTEANLGDGVFGLPGHLRAGGRLGIGSDSHVCRSWTQELRLLEYSQRLTQRRRAVAALTGQTSPATVLVEAALRGGAQASGRMVGRIAPGCRADLVVLDADDPALAARDGADLLDTAVFATDRPPIRHVMVGGIWRIRDGAHAAELGIAQAWRKALRRLLA